MRKHICLVSVILVAISFSACERSFPEDPAITKSREIISRYKAVFSAPPELAPSFHGVDGPLLGNGDLGLTVSGKPENQRFWISKNDFWKSGLHFQDCGPSLIGFIDIQIDDLLNASYRVEQELYAPAINAEFTRRDIAVKMETRVMATDNVIVIELSAMNIPVQVNINLGIKDGFGSKTASGREGNVQWATRVFNAPDLLFPSKAAIFLRSLEVVGTAFSLEPGTPITIVASVMTNHESESYVEQARDKVMGINQAQVDRLKNEHLSWWRSFWAESFIEIEDKLLEKFYYSSHYIMASCSRNVQFPPGLYGNWITMDRLAWSGDYHLDYNHQAPFWALCSSNHVELAVPYDTPLIEHLPIFIDNARNFLNKKGAYASAAVGPKGLTLKFRDKAGLKEQYKDRLPNDPFEDIAGEPFFLGMKSNAVFAAMNMLLRYRYTYDDEYLKNISPYLLAVAEFWTDYLKYEENRYVIYDDSFFEVGPWQGENWREGYGDFNPLGSLGFLRIFFKFMLETSEEMNISQDNIEKWTHILSHLSDIPVYRENGKERFRACEGGNGSGLKTVGLNWIMLHALVWPAPNIGLGSDPQQLDMIREDMKQWDDSIWLTDGNGFQTIFIAAARVGYDPRFLLSKLHEKLKRDAYPNLSIRQEGGGIETCSGVPGMINEMMLQSHLGLIRVFPVFPDDQTASFYRLRTFGAFLVSSAIENGQIQHVSIESEKGRDCRILNPWLGREIQVFRNGEKDPSLVGEELLFKTQRGERITLLPEGSTYSDIHSLF